MHFNFIRGIGRETRACYAALIGLTLTGLTSWCAIPERQEFYNTSGNGLEIPPHFPNRPSAIFPLEGERLQFPRFIGPVALIWYRGYLQFPQSGRYQLFIDGNDRAELWLSPNADESQAELQAFAQHFDNRSLFQGFGLEDRTTELDAAKGDIRYFELRLLHGGPSSLRLGWERPDRTREIVPGNLCFPFPREIISTTHTGQFPAIPNKAPSWDTRLKKASSVTVTEGDTLQFEPAIVGAQPMTFQWYRDDEPLEGEVLVRLHRQISMNDDGSTWALEARNEFGTSRFSYALNVLFDKSPPQISELKRSLEPSGLRLTFTEPIAADSATNLDHYSLVSGDFDITSIDVIDSSSVFLNGEIPRGSRRVQLQVAGIEDRATVPNKMEPALVSPSNSLEGVHFLIYEGLIPERAFSRDEYPVTRLFEEAAFPNFPTEFVSNDQIEFHTARPRSIGYAAGLLTVERTGIYKFYISSGEEGFFRLSRDHAPENLPPLSSPTLYATCCELLGADSPFETTTRSVRLVAGQSHYYDLAFTMIDQPGWFQVGWVTPIGSFADLAPIPGSALSLSAVSNPIRITEMPQSKTVQEGHSTHFTVSTEAPRGTNIGYQWFQNGVPIPDATSSRLFIPSVSLEDHGSRFTVELYDPGLQFDADLSSEAILTVEADSDPPVFNGITFNSARNEVTLKFNEPLDPESAEDVANYFVAPDGRNRSITIHSAELQPKGTVVKLITEEQRSTVYNVRVMGIRDRSTNRNTLRSSSATFGRASNGGPLLFTLLPTFGPENRSSGVQTDHPVAFYNRSQGIDSRSVRLFVNDEVVEPRFISSAAGWDMFYLPPDGWPPNTKIKVLMTHNRGENGWSFTTGAKRPPLPMYVEAEDFDFDGGQYVLTTPIGVTGFYRGGSFFRKGTQADRGIDWEDSGSALEYRENVNPTVGLHSRSRDERNKRGALGQLQFRLGRNYALINNLEGDWVNYTRDWPKGHFNVQAYLATTHGRVSARLDRVISGHGTPDQTLEPIGRFDATTSSVDQFKLFSLLDDAGNRVVLDLDGNQTLRFTVTGAPTPLGDEASSFSFDYLYFKPVIQPSVKPDVPPPIEPPTVPPAVQIAQSEENVNLLSNGVLLSSDQIQGEFTPTFGDSEPFQPSTFKSEQYFRAEEERIRIVPHGKLTARPFGTVLAIEGSAVRLELVGNGGILDAAFSIEWFLNNTPLAAQTGALVQPTNGKQQSLGVSRLIPERRQGFPQPIGTYWVRIQTNSGEVFHTQPIELVAVKQIPLPEDFDPSNQTPSELENWAASTSNRLTGAGELYDFTGNGTAFSRRAYPPKANAMLSELRAAQPKPTRVGSPFAHLTGKPSQALAIQPFILSEIDSGTARFGALRSQDGISDWLPVWFENPESDQLTLKGMQVAPEEVQEHSLGSDIGIAVGVPTTTPGTLYRALYYWQP